MRSVMSGIFAVIIVFSLSGCVQKATVAPQVDTLAVKVMTVEGSQLEKKLTFSGSVLAKKEVSISAGLAGEVLERLENVGSVVRKDQVLLRLDTENVDRSVDQAKSAYALAQVNLKSTRDRYNDAVLNLERNKALYESGGLSKAQYEQIEASAKPFVVESAVIQLNQAKIAYDSALNTSENGTVKAPFDGVIAALSPEVGSVIAPGQPIGSIVDISSFKLSFDVTEQLIGQIDFDTAVNVVIPAVGPNVLTAKITSIAPSAQMGTKLFPIEISFENPGLTIKQGMFATVELLLKSDAERVLAPYDAVLYDETGYYVMVVENNLPVKKTVVLGDDNGQVIEIISGITVGEELIVKGQAFVKVDSVLNIIRGE